MMTVLNTLLVTAGVLLTVAVCAVLADRDNIAVPTWCAAVACIGGATVLEGVIFG